MGAGLLVIIYTVIALKINSLYHYKTTIIGWNAHIAPNNVHFKSSSLEDSRSQKYRISLGNVWFKFNLLLFTLWHFSHHWKGH